MTKTPNQTSGKWRSVADLLTDNDEADVALFGAPLGEGSVTPGRCDLAPEVFRKALRRISTYDLETAVDLAGLTVNDGGDIALDGMSPAESMMPVKAQMHALVQNHVLTVMIGGNNAITCPGVHGLDPTLQSVGLLTLDAHFDLRATNEGLLNGNPVQKLLDDGLPGAHIAQIGLAPFANTAYMHQVAKQENISVYTIKECRSRGIETVIKSALDHLSTNCDSIYVDFDIDVIERSQAPGAPGARPGGMPVEDFFTATRMVGAHAKVKAADLTEFDPSFDVSDISALVSGRWFAELLAGFSVRRQHKPDKMSG